MSSEWISFVASAVIGLGYIYHLVRAVLLWRHERSVRALRNAYLATMIAVAMISITLGSLGRGYPPASEFARFVGYIVRGMLLVGAVVVVLSWHVAPEIHNDGKPR